MAAFEAVINSINNILWSMPLVFLVLGAGLYFSFRMKFPQARCLKQMIKATSSSKGSDEGLSSIQSFIFTAVAILCFSFVALLAYYMYTESNVKYLFGANPVAVRLTQVFFVASIFVGCILSASAIWTLGDIGNALMAWVNVVGLILVGNTAIRIFRDYDNQKKNGIEEPVFDPDALDIPNVGEVWKKNNH